jgi:hypothetical protein
MSKSDVQKKRITLVLHNVPIAEAKAIVEAMNKWRREHPEMFSKVVGGAA